jgi:hypothetical protein
VLRGKFIAMSTCIFKKMENSNNLRMHFKLLGKARTKPSPKLVYGKK